MFAQPINTVETYDTRDPAQRAALNAKWSLTDAERAELRFKAACTKLSSFVASNLTLAQSAQFFLTDIVPADLSPRAAARLADLVEARRLARVATLPPKTSRKAA